MLSTHTRSSLGLLLNGPAVLFRKGVHCLRETTMAYCLLTKMYNSQHACIQSERSPPFRWWRCVHGPGEQDRMKSPWSCESWMAGFWSVCSQPRTDPKKPSRAVGEPTSNEVTHLVLSPASGQQQSEPTLVKQRAFTGFTHTHFLSVFPKTKPQCGVWTDNTGSRWWDQTHRWLSSLSQTQRPACLPAVSMEPKHSCGFCHLQGELLMRWWPCPSRVPGGKSSDFIAQGCPPSASFDLILWTFKFLTQSDSQWGVT